MKIANITPGLGSIIGNTSSFEFILGQYYKPRTRYYDKFSNPNKFRMMDNGEAEGQRVDDFEALYNLHCHLVDEFVMPDSYRNRDETFRLLKEYKNLVPPIKRAICPQGDDMVEWGESFVEMDKLLEGSYATICVPKHMERYGRSHIVERLVELKYHRIHHIHLLGVWTNPITELQVLKDLKQYIRSMDTGAALAWAQWGCRVDETEPGERFSLDWEEEEDIEIQLDGETVVIGRYNAWRISQEANLWNGKWQGHNVISVR